MLIGYCKRGPFPLLFKSPEADPKRVTGAFRACCTFLTHSEEATPEEAKTGQ